MSKKTKKSERLGKEMRERYNNGTVHGIRFNMNIPVEPAIDWTGPVFSRDAVAPPFVGRNQFGYVDTFRAMVEPSKPQEPVVAESFADYVKRTEENSHLPAEYRRRLESEARTTIGRMIITTGPEGSSVQVEPYREKDKPESSLYDLAPWQQNILARAAEKTKPRDEFHRRAQKAEGAAKYLYRSMRRYEEMLAKAYYILGVEIGRGNRFVVDPVPLIKDAQLMNAFKNELHRGYKDGENLAPELRILAYDTVSLTEQGASA